MNKLLVAAAVATTFAAASMTARAVDGTINISGSVISSTCKINNASSPVSVNVTLPTVATTALTSASAVAGRTPFSIALSSCGSSLTKATTFFEPGPNIDTTTGNLKNTAASNNVEVQLLNAADFSPINLGAAQGSQNSSTATISSGSATLNYYAQYYATAAASAGTVTSSVQFTMIYQ